MPTIAHPSDYIRSLSTEALIRYAACPNHDASTRDMAIETLLESMTHRDVIALVYAQGVADA